jgi:type I restriction enzyme M protein
MRSKIQITPTKALEEYSALLDEQSDAKSRLKKAQEELDAKLDAKYPTLTDDEVKKLVVEDKWLATVAAAVQRELDQVSQTLTSRIRQLAERYETPLPELAIEVETLATRVEGHLNKMGFIAYVKTKTTERVSRSVETEGYVNSN